MPLIDAVVSDLVARPGPVLCLDTCDFLNLLECVAESEPRKLEWPGRIIAAATDTPRKAFPCVSFLVELEFAQNIDRKVQELEKHIRKIDQQAGDLFEGANLAGAGISDSPRNYGQHGMPARLRSFAEAILRSCTRLDRDPDCVLRAVNRVVAKTRPSHRGELKDSIHIEHYLELARRCRTLGFSEQIVFVSSNSKDFWESSDKSELHPDLRPEFTSVGVRFFGKWEAACGFLGL